MTGCRRRILAGTAWALFASALVACSSPAPSPCAGVSCKVGYSCVVDNAGKGVCKPPDDPCGTASPCKADETCVVNIEGLASCLAPDRCKGVTCATDKKCDPATGQCTIARAACDGITCQAGQVCNPATGACEAADAKCLRVCCASGFVCDPSTGECVDDKCSGTGSVECNCGPSEVCNGVTGECDAAVTACGKCAATEYCDPGAGACVAIVRGTPAAGEIGAACGSASNCTRSGTDAFCLADGGLFGEMPGGMCSASCDQQACPRGSGCIDIGLAICLDICRDKGDCRSGYTCSQITSDDPRRYCFPEGGAGSTCTGSNCQPIGGACTADNDCVSGAECSRNLPGGYCQKRKCRDSDCPEGGNCWCLTADACNGAKIALSKCDTRLQNCRAGYSCYPLTADNIEGYCYPRQCEEDNDCREAGTSCNYTCDKARGICDTYCKSNADCFGDRACDTSSGHCYQPCVTESEYCGADAYCDVSQLRCVRKCRSDATCGSGEFCDRGTGKCQARCSGDASCDEGKFCDATGQCRARCESDASCGSNEYCDAGRCLLRCTATSNCTFGEFCNSTSGRCVRDLKTVLVGNPCTSSGQCGAYNAECLSSWPDGYCAATDCADNAPCGVGSACVSMNSRRMCLKTCSGDADCRAGYACVEEQGNNGQGNGNGSGVAGAKVCRPR